MKDSIDQIINNSFKESITIKSKILKSNLINQIEKVSLSVINCSQNRSKIFLQKMEEV